MAREVKRWITVNGKHVPIYEKLNKRLMEKVDSLFNTDESEEEIDNPIPTPPHHIWKEGEAAYQKAKEEGTLNYENREVDVDKLESIQATVFKDTFKQIVPNVHGEISGWSAVENHYSKTDTGIRAFEYDGHIIIVDGNHRANVAILNGQKRLKLRVANVSRKGN